MVSFRYIDEDPILMVQVKVVDMCLNSYLVAFVIDDAKEFCVICITELVSVRCAVIILKIKGPQWDPCGTDDLGEKCMKFVVA